MLETVSTVAGQDHGEQIIASQALGARCHMGEADEVPPDVLLGLLSVAT